MSSMSPKLNFAMCTTHSSTLSLFHHAYSTEFFFFGLK